jgi:hypothetical protein
MLGYAIVLQMALVATAASPAPVYSTDHRSQNLDPSMPFDKVIGVSMTSGVRLTVDQSASSPTARALFRSDEIFRAMTGG